MGRRWSGLVRWVSLVALEGAETFVLARRSGRLLSYGRAGAVRLQAEDEVSDVNLVAFADDRGLRDLSAVDVGPVRALEVRDDEAAVAEEEARVMFRDVPFREHQ